MDDMDKEAQELGGKARFFTNGYEKYAWTKVMDSRIGGQDRLNLYVEAVTTLSQNPHLPQLFRDIFKDAFLPYRDPETLNLFLKEINGFNYDHSEDLGDAFEYLLSILGSQGDAGQFRTPRHIIDFIVEAVDPKKEETICDPACGTAGFLISAFKHILKENKEKSLTPDEKKNLMDHFVGYDISPDMVRLSKVNLYLHGFPNPTIFEYDTLSSEEKWDENFDVMLANPPFMSPKGGIRPHKRFSVQANRSEVLFVDYILEHLRPNGRAGIIVPEGIIFQSATAYKTLRKLLIEDGLLAVVSLPAGVFNPYAGVKTSILLFDNGLAKKTKDILFLKIQNDGYDLGAQRREIDKNDLPLALEIIKEYKIALKENKKFKLDEKQDKIAHLVTKEKIAESGDYNLSGDRYREDVKIQNSNFKIVALGELEKSEKITFLRGQGISKKDIIQNGKNKCIHYGEIYTLYQPVIKEVISRTNVEGKILSKKGDVLVPSTTTADAFGIAVARSLNEDGVIIGGDINIIRTGNEYVLSDYLAYLISNSKVKNQLATFAKGVNILHLSNNDLRKIKIPLPPLEVQKEIVEQIEVKQKAIEAAKAVIENLERERRYFGQEIRKIKDVEWVELGEVADFIRGPFGGSLKKEIFKPSGYLVYEQYHAINNDFNFGRYFIDERKFNEMKRFEVFPGDLLISCSGTMGKIAIVPKTAKQGIINQALLKLTPHNKRLIAEYLKLILEADFIQNKYFKDQSGSSIQNVASVKILQKIKIPLPPLEVQKQLVAEMKEQEKIIEANKKLIGIMGQKITEVLREI
ncbi:MAG TPA: N-6 DNA methylase [Desulfotomaculum sp.]|nr:N-6 DNA methylase [Desulfotomaculum sp.]